MEVNVEKVGACVARVSLSVPADEFEGAVSRALRDAGRNVRMKGFRPGKVPAAVIARTHSAEVRRHAAEHFLRQAYQRAVGENDLKVVGLERVDLEKVSVEPGAGFSHAFEVNLRPAIEIEGYTGLEVESALEPVADRDIEVALGELRRREAKPEAAESLPEDGMAVASVAWRAGAETVLARDGLRISPAVPLPGLDPEAYRRALAGAKVGDTVSVALTFPADFPKEEARGKAGACEIRIDEAYRMIPASDDDLRALLGVDANTGLEAAVRERIEAARRESEDRRIESVLLERLIEAHPMELPERMLAEQTKMRRSQLERQLAEQGLDEAAVEQQASGQEPSLREASARGLRALFLIQTLAEKEGLLVNQADMTSELRTIAERNGATLEEVGDYYRKNDLFDQMAIEILERKVRRFLRESAQVTAPS